VKLCFIITIDDDGIVCAGDARMKGETGRRADAAVTQQSHDRTKGEENG
jgi:hypothetical protein